LLLEELDLGPAARRHGGNGETARRQCKKGGFPHGSPLARRTSSVLQLFRTSGASARRSHGFAHSCHGIDHSSASAARRRLSPASSTPFDLVQRMSCAGTASCSPAFNRRSSVDVLSAPRPQL